MLRIDGGMAHQDSPGLRTRSRQRDSQRVVISAMSYTRQARSQGRQRDKLPHCVVNAEADCDISCVNCSWQVLTVKRICSSVWLAVMKKRSRAAASSTAGWRIGWTLMPALEHPPREQAGVERVAEDHRHHRRVVARRRCSARVPWPVAGRAAPGPGMRATRSGSASITRSEASAAARVGRRHAHAEHESRRPCISDR